MENLAVSDRVLRIDDVTVTVSGSASDSHPLMVAVLAGGKVIGDLQLAATCEDIVIGDIQSVYGRGTVNSHYTMKRRRLRLTKYRRGTALLLGASNSDNYYHWLLESLPRWKMLQAAGWHEYDFVLLHGQQCDFQDRTLDWLNVPRQRRLRCSKNFVHQFEKLVVPAMPFARKTVPSWPVPWLREIGPSAPSGYEKVYLSRLGVLRRRLVNEAELQSALEARGFVTFNTGNFSVTEQAQYLRSARWIVAPHGAALANMVFASPGAGVLEFFHPQHKNRCYENLATACGHRYACLDGHAISKPRSRQLEYVVDIPEVLAAVEKQEPVPR